MMPTPYPDLNAVLQDLVDSVQTILGSNFVGAYLQGSFAVGDFDQHSDVDFIVVTKEALSDGKVEALQMMHGHIYDHDVGWAQHLEGSYFPQDVWRRLPRPDTKLWYLDNGSRSLTQSDHCNTLVVRWTVREKGIPLAGPPPQTLLKPISVPALRQEIWQTMTEWGQEILDDPARYNNRFYQGFIVLSYCRMMHSLYAGLIASKRTGAEWAKKQLDPAWSGLIDRAWDTRPDPAVSVRQPADPADFAATLEFISHVINESRVYVASPDD